jgi:hypothetical protein
MKHILVVMACVAVTGCTVCNDPEPARIVHVVDADWDSNDYTIVEFEDGARFRRSRQWGSVGDEFMACRCQDEGRQWWTSAQVRKDER